MSKDEHQSSETPIAFDPARVPSVLKSRSSEWVLAVIAFTESTLSPIIVDPFLIAMTLAKTNAWVRYACIASAWSVLGGAVGYFLGVLFFDFIGEHIIALYGLEDHFLRTRELFEANVFLVTLVGAFTPLPYKLFALTGGLLKVNFLLFILASIVGRAGRFFLVAYVAKRLGEYATARMRRIINIVTAVLIVAVLIYGVLSVMH